MNTHNICFHVEIRKILFGYPLLSVAMIKQPHFINDQCNLTLEVRGTRILKILWKRGEIAPKEQFLLFFTIFCYLLLDFHV